MNKVLGFAATMMTAVLSYKIDLTTESTGNTPYVAIMQLDEQVEIHLTHSAGTGFSWMENLPD